MIMLGIIQMFGSSLKNVMNEHRNKNYEFDKTVQCVIKKNYARSKSGGTRSEQELRRQEDYDYQERKKLGLDSIFHFEEIKFSLFDFCEEGRI